MIKKSESERAVTEILESSDMLKLSSKNIYKVLQKKESKHLSQNSISPNDKEKNSKYSFITLGLWKW